MRKAQGIAQSANQGQFKNRIINGDCRIDQRNAGASVTPTDGQYTLDRWRAGASASSKFSVQQSSVAPAGFNFSMLVTSLSAYSLSTNDNFEMFQFIEGFNSSDLGWGTANAQPVTISFWVRSSLTGTFGGAINNSAFNRSYPFSYTINAANTWEQKSITIAGDTGGSWVGATNGLGLALCIGLGAGSGRSGTAGAWASSTFYNATGAVNLVGTNGATFYITGVQLEKGSTATSFDYRPYGTELALCQRYYVRFGAYWGVGHGDTTNIVLVNLNTPVPMRALPSILNSADSNGIVANGSLYNLVANSGNIPNGWYYQTSGAATFSTNAQVARWTTAYCRITDLQLSSEL
jgi:hypothetical protein